MSNFTLDQKLIFIGFQITSADQILKNVNCDIEQTIHAACLEVPNDSRLFSLVCSWVSVHGDYVITEKLMKLQKKQNSEWLVAVAVCAVNLGFHKWKRLIKKQKKEIALVDIELAKSSISIKGAEDNFKKYGFLIPKGGIRVRSSDVLTTEKLIHKNIQFRNRFLFGASWRADIITAIQMGIKTPYEISKKIGCSYEPAHRIFKEYALALS
jgi:hypothetical protein